LRDNIGIVKLKNIKKKNRTKQYLAVMELEHFGWNVDKIFEIGRDSKQKKEQDIPIINSNITELTFMIFLLPIWLKA
jgi:hypothetical protein